MLVLWQLNALVISHYCRLPQNKNKQKARIQCELCSCLFYYILFTVSRGNQVYPKKRPALVVSNSAFNPDQCGSTNAIFSLCLNKWIGGKLRAASSAAARLSSSKRKKKRTQNFYHFITFFTFINLAWA
jgi:hypothetical protein